MPLRAHGLNVSILTIIDTYKFFLGRVLVQSSQIPSQENFAVLNSRASILGPDRGILIIATVSSREDAGCDVVLQKLLVDRIDDVRNDLADEILTTLEGCKII